MPEFSGDIDRQFQASLIHPYAILFLFFFFPLSFKKIFFFLFHYRAQRDTSSEYFQYVCSLSEKMTSFRPLDKSV